MQKNHSKFSFRRRMIPNGLIPVILLLLAGITIVTAETLNLAVTETPLNPAGSAYEVNMAPNGTLVVSDYIAGEIRIYSPDGSLVDIYSGLGNVSDARMDATGTLWFVEGGAQCLGQLDPPYDELVCWPFPDIPVDYVVGNGLALEEGGRIWVSNYNDPYIYRFDSLSSRWCTLAPDDPVPFLDGSAYVVKDAGDGNVWFAFYTDKVLVSFNETSDEAFVYRSPNADFSIYGLIGDGEGGIWFADSNYGSIRHLHRTDTGENFYRYAIPAGAFDPYMLTLENDRIWFTEFSGSSSDVGMLDPNVVTPEDVPFTKSPYYHSFTCDETPVTPIIRDVPPVISIAPTWTKNDYTLIPATQGWTIFEMPEDSQPWGIQYADNRVWIVDSGRQLLVRNSFHQVYLPMLLR